jgi:hypothetical protein
LQIDEFFFRILFLKYEKFAIFRDILPFFEKTIALPTFEGI